MTLELESSEVLNCDFLDSPSAAMARFVGADIMRPLEDDPAMSHFYALVIHPLHSRRTGAATIATG